MEFTLTLAVENEPKSYESLTKLPYLLRRRVEDAIKLLCKRLIKDTSSLKSG